MAAALHCATLLRLQRLDRQSGRVQRHVGQERMHAAKITGNSESSIAHHMVQSKI